MNNKELEINTKVRISSFSNKIGTISKVKRNTCVVLVDELTIEVPLDAVVVITEKKKKTPIKHQTKKIVRNNKSPTIDLHGLTKDEAQDKIEYFLSDCLVKGYDSCIIIHGIGTGALKDLTHTLLANLKKVKNFTFEDSNPGQTKVYL